MNRFDATFYAVLEIWAELPRLLGRDYAALHHPLLKKLEAVYTSSLAERDLRVGEVFDLLEPFPAARRRLREVRRGTDRIRDQAHTRGETAVFDDQPRLYGPALRERLQPPRVVRYTDITAPRRLPAGERGVITVALVEEADDDSVLIEAVELLFDRRVDVHLIAITPSLEILNTKVQPLSVRLSEAEPERVVFFVRSKIPGKAHLCLDFRQGGEWLAGLPLTIEMTPGPASSEAHRPTSQRLETGSLSAPPSDLDFRVTRAAQGGVTQFHYTLHSPNGAVDAFYWDVAGPEIVGTPESYREGLFARLEAAGSEEISAAAAYRRLVGIGEQIFDLLPDEIQSLLNQLDPEVAHTVQIVSDEPWIPWELLRPRASEPREENFWCESFAVTRWLAGNAGPEGLVVVSRGIWIEADGASDLDDGHPLRELTAAKGVDIKALRSATLAEMEAILDSESPDFWHIEAPGRLSTDGHQVGVDFETGALWSMDLDRARSRRIAERRPLVFFNVEGGGRQNWTLTRLEGWASKWVSQCSCGGFIAPICRVDDQLGRFFSSAFYEALGQGETLGEAVRKARAGTKTLDAANPTWAIFSAYGHPNARVVFTAPTEDEGR